MRNVSVRQWIENFDAGKYNELSKHVQCEAGWYDWFCKNQSLRGKTYALAPKVKRIAKSSKINKDIMCVCFKNNSPMCGSLYDDFRFADIETGEIIYAVVPSCGHLSLKGQSEVWGRENDFVEPLVRGTWKDVLAFFNII